MTGENQDQPAGNAGADAAAGQANDGIEETRFNIRAQYLKDISFENPNAPVIYGKLNSQPNIGVSMDVQARALENNNFEITLSSNVEAKFDDTPAFLVELQYCALVAVAEGISQEQLGPLLLVEIPHFLFPFVRELISSATRDGGFPPLMINPVDFGKLYQRQRERVASQQAAGDQGAAQPTG